jgi:hypothetical protein
MKRRGEGGDQQDYPQRVHDPLRLQTARRGEGEEEREGKKKEGGEE